MSCATNACVFGNPGVGKTNAVAAIGHELVRQGHAVFFTTVQALVEHLLAAKRDLGQHGSCAASTACASIRTGVLAVSGVTARLESCL